MLFIVNSISILCSNIIKSVFSHLLNTLIVIVLKQASSED